MGELSTTTKFTHNNKGLSSMFRNNKCHGLWPLLTALVLNMHVPHLKWENKLEHTLKNIKLK